METIVALATPPLKSALAIIRISGDDTFNIVSKLINKDVKDTKERTCFYANIKNQQNEIIDETVVILYKGPKSFTGEDLAEIICHGSMLIANEIIETIISYGARYATNGEYSSRAFINQKVDLIQAEAINDVINATNEEAKKLSMMSLKGQTSQLVKPIREKIADLLCNVEVNIDYPEYQDIEVVTKGKIVKTCSEINSSIQNLIQRSEKALLVKDGLKVSIIGKPNVGKSSLLNALLNEDKAIVTDVAGTTRDVVEGDVNLNGITLHLLDTAGIHESNDKVETIGVNKAKASIERADIVIVVFDGSLPQDEEDQKILELSKNKQRIIVYNKIDQVNVKDANKLYISALNKNIQPLIDEIKRMAGISNDVYEIPSLNNVRQIGLLKKAYLALEKAKEDAQTDLPIDLVSVNLTEAYHSILEILGEEKQDVLYRDIFSRFCIGK